MNKRTLHVVLQLHTSSSSFINMSHMKQRSLWCCLFFKPAISFHPLSSVSTIVAKATMKGNILLHNLVIPCYCDGILSIKRDTSNDDQSSSFSLMQQGGVTILPFLSSILNFIAQQRICIALCYILLANTIYRYSEDHTCVK